MGLKIQCRSSYLSDVEADQVAEGCAQNLLAQFEGSTQQVQAVYDRNSLGRSPGNDWDVALAKALRAAAATTGLLPSQRTGIGVIVAFN